MVLQLHQAAFGQLPKLGPGRVSQADFSLPVGCEFVGAPGDDGEDDGHIQLPQQRQHPVTGAGEAVVKAENDGLLRQRRAAVRIGDHPGHGDGMVALLLQPDEVAPQLRRGHHVLARMDVAHVMIHEDGQSHPLLRRAGGKEEAESAEQQE